MNMMFTLCLLLCAALALGQKPSQGLSLTKCQKEASVTPLIGAYVPQCDSQGQYLPTQYWSSTGYCWCVNAAGEEVPGTRTPPGQPRPNCAVSPDRPLTKCQREANVTHLPGAYIPQCDSQGHYLPTQCWGSTGYCWCVNAAGEEVPGTRTPPGQPRPNCAGYVNSTGKEVQDTRTPPGQPRPGCAVSPDRPLTKCQKEANVYHLPGAYIPQCDSQGHYLPTQCSGSTGYCWCVNTAGEEVPGTRTPPGQPGPICTVRPQTYCEYWRASVTRQPGAYIPQCDSEGQFLPTQCCGSTGYCWCVNVVGDEVPGTRIPPGQPGHSCAVVPLTFCQVWRNSVSPLFGVYTPQCDPQGQFLPTQCWTSTGRCWCVNAAGDMISNTETAPGQPRPNCAVVPLTFCQMWRNSVSPLPGSFIPECDSHGQFKPTQCWASTGYCWCFNPAGETIPGTLTPLGQPRPTCE